MLMWDQFSLSFILGDTNFLPGGDAAAALSDTTFYTTYIQSPEGNTATSLVSLHSLSALVKQLFFKHLLNLSV